MEEWRNSINKRRSTRTAVVKDMSSSPALRKSKTKKEQAAKKTKEGSMTMQQKPGNVSTIAKFFVKTVLPIQVSASMVTMPNKHNNNAVCSATVSQTPSSIGKWADPVMAM